MPTLSLSARRAARARPGVLLPLLLPLVVGGCGAIYEDTKGWASRLEASLLSTAPDGIEPDEPTADAQHEERPAPPAVPVEPVTVVALPTPPPPAPPSPAVAAPGESEKVSGGVLAAASEALLADADAKAPDAKAPDTKSADDAVVAVVLHLSSLRSEEAAKRQWSDLQHSFPEPLGPLQAEISRTDLGDRGSFYRVLAGPLPSRDEATQVCAALKAKNAKQYCRILPTKPKA